MDIHGRPVTSGTYRLLERTAIARLAWFRPDGFTAFLAALGLLGAALVLLRVATYGVGLIWDSIIYISVTRNLLEGEDFIQFSGDHYVLWPPLFPMLLALASLHVFDPHDVAGFVNAAAFGLTLFVSGQ